MPSFYNATKNQLRSQEQGADTIVYLAASEEALSYTSGDFFFDRKPAVKHLWLGGTGYSIDDVDCLVSRLRSIVAERKHSLPE